MGEHSVEEIDELLTEISGQRFVAASELPEWINTTGFRHVTETTHKGSLSGRDGEQFVYYGTDDVVDSLLDLRQDLAKVPETC